MNTTEQLAHDLLEQLPNHPKFQIKKEWGVFGARWDWEWFCTFTFTEDIHEEAAIKLFKVWRNKLSRDIYGPRWHKKTPHGVQYILAIELTKNKRIHLHAVLRGLRDQFRDNFRYMDIWLHLDDFKTIQKENRETGKTERYTAPGPKRTGFARIYAVDNSEAVCAYITKYVTKDGELFISENLQVATQEAKRQASLL